MSATKSVPDRSPKSGPRWLEKLADVNRELWLLLSLFIIAGVLNWLVASRGMVLGFYTLPTLFSAYVYGRRHAVLTAMASVLLVIVVAYANPALFVRASVDPEGVDRWFDLCVWAGLLIITAYAMGTLYERKESHFRELRRTYFGVLTILQQFISNDKYTHNHSYRVAMYAAIIAHRMGFSEDRIDDVRAAALLHDIGKLETSRDILYKAASLTPEEMSEMREPVQKGVTMLGPIGGALRRILPIILAHHDKYDGSGYQPLQGEEIPVEARVLAVADAYDTLTSDRPYRRAVTPFEAKEIIATGSGASFDPNIVEAFVKAFDAREMDLPESVLI
ncbi:MAG TPA: HD-GYP domain-containing protein [Terriglobales bacterium]|nr:HD-GYP domain-containing protein [Terriglobales bacterium]